MFFRADVTKSWIKAISEKGGTDCKKLNLDVRSGR